MGIVKFVWKLVGVGVALQYGYWGVMFAGAWLNINAPPIVSNDWIALGFFGAFFLALENCFPFLRDRSSP